MPGEVADPEFPFADSLRETLKFQTFRAFKFLNDTI